MTSFHKETCKAGIDEIEDEHTELNVAIADIKKAFEETRSPKILRDVVTKSSAVAACELSVACDMMHQWANHFSFVTSFVCALLSFVACQKLQALLSCSNAVMHVFILFLVLCAWFGVATINQSCFMCVALHCF